jgi:glycosyltransferase involved in cell wall biosynthesis
VSLCIFIPAYNAAETIAEVLTRIPPEAWDAARAVIILDDGSTDATARVVEELRPHYSKLELVSSPRNQGYGPTVRRGLQLGLETGADYIACLHADGQYPPERLPEFVEHMRRHRIDVLQGSRHKEGGALAGGMPVYKMLAGRVLTGLENLAFGLKMTDYHSGFLVYSRRAVSEVPIHTLSAYFDFDLEFIACARRRGLRIDELAIPTRYADEVSHLNPIRYGLRVLGVIAKFRTGRYDRMP